MIVKELIETREIFIDKVANNYYVVYEETLSKDFDIKHNYFFEKSSLTKKAINIFKGDSSSSLQKIKGYKIENAEIESMKEIIEKDFPEVFIA